MVVISHTLAKSVALMSATDGDGWVGCVPRHARKRLEMAGLVVVAKTRVNCAKVLEVSTVAMFQSRKSQLWQCHSVQVSDRGSGPKPAKMARNGSRMVARS